MVKKIILGLAAGIIVVAGIAAMSAFEAHVINVTAHIENALYVHPDKIHFGTVFPQEYVESDFTVELSTSFQAADRVDDVKYVIKQKPKCWNNNPKDPKYAPVDYATETCPKIEDVQYVEMLSLCPYLSKLDGDPEDGNDIGEPSYYDEATNTCPPRTAVVPSGMLTKLGEDFSDLWKVDLKVPPVKGYVGQDWPAGCPTVVKNDQDYGCDLWVEVIEISNTHTQLD